MRSTACPDTWAGPVPAPIRTGAVTRTAAMATNAARVGMFNEFGVC